MATPEAIERRRANRRAQTLSAYQRQQERDRRNAEASRRMAVRFFPGEAPDLMKLDYRFWQSRRFGYDPLSKQVRTFHGVLYEPTTSPYWMWWTALHYETRAKLVETNQHRLTRDQFRK